MITVPIGVPSGITNEPVNAVAVPLSPTLYVRVGVGTSVSVLLSGFSDCAVTVMVFPAISDVGLAFTVMVGVALFTVTVIVFAAFAYSSVSAAVISTVAVPAFRAVIVPSAATVITSSPVLTS